MKAAIRYFVFIRVLEIEPFRVLKILAATLLDGEARWVMDLALVRFYANLLIVTENFIER